MPPRTDKKWDDAAERDLLLAIITSSNDGNMKRFRCNWTTVADTMDHLGYHFTRTAISRHFTKVILKDHKSRHCDLDTAPDSPGKMLAKKMLKEAVKSESPVSVLESADRFAMKKADSPCRNAARHRAKRASSSTVMDAHEAAFSA